MTTYTDERAARLRTALANAMEADGQLTDPAWRKVFETVPRHPFVPEFWTLAGGRQRHVTSADPRWLDLVYTDDALATRLTDGVATSSSTAPGLMLTMLQALDAADGHRVLEVATGTGYNAALLSKRLGSDHVVTAEVGLVPARLAESRPRRCGYPSLAAFAAFAADDAFRFLLSLTAPDTASASERDDDGRVTAVELWCADGSWARAEGETVRQSGPRLLWDAAEAAHELYVEHDRPGRERFGVTVTPERQHTWLDSPSRPVPRVPAAVQQ
ncbi:protein-L-isoaspartate(D-aspartate) O-methyltransferase [Streptomyces sp. NPDC057654]|uniref:protein-L-isoaspartate(D-aspartate) O-methyltransferase n=1 Tax=Streptomyces sp. NPDC057654 TaxID=3346196 RepID=UPI00368E27A8